MTTYCPAFQYNCKSIGSLVSCSQCLVKHKKRPVKERETGRQGFRVRETIRRGGGTNV